MSVEAPQMSTEALTAFERTRKAWPAEMMVPLVKIPRYTDNPRINDPAVPDVMDSLKHFGARQPIVIWKVDGQIARGDGAIIVGDTRWCAADRLGWPEFPVHAMDCTEAEAIAYRLADNKTGERAEWNFPLLKLEFERMADFGMPLEFSGFRDYEIAPILASDWTPPPVESMPDVGTSGDDKKQVIGFNAIGWERVLKAAEKMRRESNRQDLGLAEVVTKLCINYLDGPGT